LKKNIAEKITDWIKAGGRLIAMGEAINVLANNDNFDIKEKETPKDTTVTLEAFEKCK